MDQLKCRGTLSGKLSFLVVDDEPSVALVCKRLLERAGHQVFSLHDSSEALDFFKENHAEIDILLCDMVMPKISGDIFITHVLKINPDLPTILMSGNTFKLPESLQAFSSVSLLDKPIEKEMLFNAIQHALHNTR